MHEPADEGDFVGRKGLIRRVGQFESVNFAKAFRGPSKARFVIDRITEQQMRIWRRQGHPGAPIASDDRLG
jgi:hypothetical protein